MGCLTWFDQDWTSTINVVLAYVLPQHRLKGYHTAMFEALVAKARELKRPVINSTVHAANEPSRRAMLKQGREIEGFYTRYRVPLG